MILSTDSEEYAELGRVAGAEIPFLCPAALAVSETSAMSVVKHCLAYCEKEGRQPEAVAYLQPTSPFRTSAQIDEGLSLLAQEGQDTVLSLAPVRHHPSFMWQLDGERRISRVAPNLPIVERSQDLSPVYVETALIIITRSRYLLDKTISAPVVNYASFVPLIVDSESAIDINTEEDFSYAEFIEHRRLKRIPDQHA